MPRKNIRSIEHLIQQVRQDYAAWDTRTRPWFRGEPDIAEKPLRPKAYRRSCDEDQLLQNFRMKAPSLGIASTPPREHTDEWLFLAQHFGLPTRLLDWTEGLLFAVYFALNHEKQKTKGSAVWMLNPVELNNKTHAQINKIRKEILVKFNRRRARAYKDNEFDLAWFSKELDTHFWMRMYYEHVARTGALNTSFLSWLSSGSFAPNIANLNVRGAWEHGRVGTEYPVALLPSYVHERMSMQRSCFTIHGKVRKGFDPLIRDRRILIKYTLHKGYTNQFRRDLRMLGITHASVFPDLGGLASDLTELYVGAK